MSGKARLKSGGNKNSIPNVNRSEQIDNNIFGTIDQSWLLTIRVSNEELATI